MKSNYKLCCILIINILTIHPSILLAQGEQITGSFNSNFSRVTLDENSVESLKDSGVGRSQLEKIFEVVQTYQSQRGEALGIEIRTDFNRGAILSARPDLGPREIAISPGILMELEKTYSHPRYNTMPDLKGSLEQYLAGQGVHAKTVEDLRRKWNRSKQMIDPVDGTVSPDDLANIETNLCPEKRVQCNGRKVSYDIPELINSIEYNLENSKDLSKCRASMSTFRRMYRNSDSHSTVADIKANPEIWAAAAAFETDCLVTVAQSIPELEYFSVIKHASATAPYCGAFRIGPQQFVSAMHCFLSRNGKIDLAKPKNSSIFLLGTPTRSIPFSISTASIRQFIRRYPDGVASEREMPAIRDIVVLESAAIDERTDSDFRDIVSQPVIGRDAFLPGYFQYNSERRSKPNDWPAGIRLTKVVGTSYCRLYDVAVTRSGAGCLIHRCQAIGGYSGSPLLQETSDGKLTLVGVHVRGAGNYVENCPAVFVIKKASQGTGSEPITGFANIATMASTELLTNLGWKLGGKNEIQ